MEEVVGSIPTRSTKSPNNLDTVNHCDSAVQSPILLGQDRELSLSQPEVQEGIIVLNTPAAWQDPEVRKRMLAPIQDED